MSPNIRREERVNLKAPVRVGWIDQERNSKYLIAGIGDISESGMRLETVEPIPAQTSVGIQCERLSLACSGLVRSCVRKGAKYWVGVEFTGKVKMNREAAGLIHEQ
jgi:PilZ domain